MCNAEIVGFGVTQMCDLVVAGCAFGVMGRDWRGRGVYWQIAGKGLAGVVLRISQRLSWWARCGHVGLLRLLCLRFDVG